MKSIYIALTVLILCLISSCQTTPSTDNGADKDYPFPYEIGSQTLFIHDDTRPYDSVGGVDTGVRSMITEIWYPVDNAAIHEVRNKYRLATYGDYSFGDEDVHRKMMTETTFFHLTPDTVIEGVTQDQIDEAIDDLFTRKRNSYIAAPLVSGDERLPVVVMSHGDAGSRYNMETACEFLAAHGYFVIAPEHTGNSPYSFTGKDPDADAKLADVLPLLNEDGTYGSTEKYGQTYTPLIRDRSDPQALVNLDNALLQRVNDLRATVRELEKLNSEGEFAGRLKLDKIGLMGRSFGGTTTLAALALEARFTAGVAVVPLVTPDFRSDFPAELLKGPGQESVLLAADGPAALHTIQKPTMLLSGAEDSLIIGVGAAMAESMGGEIPTPQNPLPPLRAAYENTDQPVIWGLLRKSNHSSFGVSGGYWWPHLKPARQEHFFPPRETFTLIKPVTAHLIQKHKVKQFFDVMIRGDRLARGPLLYNEFTQQGLIYEARNFDRQVSEPGL